MIEHQTDRPSSTTACGCTRTRTPAAARRGCSRRSAGSAPTRSASIRRTRRPSRRARGTSASTPDAAGARQRARRRHHGDRGRRICARRPTAPCRKPSSRAGVRDLRVRYRGRRRPASCAVMPQPDFAFPLDDVLAAITRADAGGVPDQPEQPDRRRRCRWRRFGRSRGACRQARSCSSTRRTPSSRGETFIPELPAFPNVIVGRTFSKAFGLAGLRIGAADRRTGDALEPIRRGGAGLQRQHRRRRRACRRRSRIAAYSTTTCVRSRSRRRCSTPRAIGWGCTYWKSAANFVLVRAGDQTAALVEGRARARHLPARPLRPSRAAPAASASPPASSSTRAACIAAMEEVLCAARVIDRRTTETQIALTLALEGKGRYQVSTGIRFLDHMLELFARHGGFDLTVDGDRRSRRRPASHRRGSRHRARRGGVARRSATAAASTAPATS